MQHYIGFSWNYKIAEHTTLAKKLVGRLKTTLPGWKCAIASDGLQVLHAGARSRSSQVYLLDQNAGVVLGCVFNRSLSVDRFDARCDSDDTTFDVGETQKIRQSKGRHLTNHYWGRYVAILRGDDDVRIRIIRDPTGAMPCFATKFRDIDIVCSHIEDCAALDLIKCTINWDHIAAYQWFQNVVTKETGLDSVRQVLAGECLEIRDDSRHTSAAFYWSPDRICDAGLVEDREQALRKLRDVIQYCVDAWSSQYCTILHELSGGLDSAVVLACLSESLGKTNVVCENYYTQSAQGDERTFARIAAESAGVELIETLLSPPSQTPDRIFDQTKVATPKLMRLITAVEPIREHIVSERGIEAVFSGQGGDHFFESIKTPLIAAEYGWRHGLRPEILRVIADTSRFTRSPLWSVIAAVIRFGLSHRYEDPYDRLRPPPLVSAAVADAMGPNSIRHPWIDSAKHLPGSKLLQIFNIIDSQNFYRTPCRHSDTVHPLISQPIIELCLQIPSYVLTYDGIDRALVRDAFTGLVPQEITGRTLKGGTTNIFNRLLVGNLPFIREYLLGGLLVGEGVLDHAKTEASLTEEKLICEPYLLIPVLSAFRAEAWLRTWVSDGQEVAV